MLRDLLAGAWDARALVQRLVLEVDKVLEHLDTVFTRLDELGRMVDELRAELAKRKGSK